MADGVSLRLDGGQPTPGALARKVRPFGWVLLAAALFIGPHLLYLGQPYFMDESPILTNVVKFFQNQTLLPVDTRYPTFYSYVVAPGIALQAVWRSLLGGDGGIAASVGSLYRFEPLALIWPARLVSTLALLLTSTLLGLFLGRRIAFVAGSAAAIALLASPALLAYAAYGVPDVLTLFLTAAAFVFACRYAEGDSSSLVPRDAALGAICAGLAVSSKYTGAPVALPLLVAIAYRVRTRGEAWQRGLRTACACGLLLAGSFLVGSPGWILAPEAFLEGLHYEIEHAATGHLGTSGVPILGQLQLLVTGAPLLTLGGVAGFAIWLRSRSLLGGLASSLAVGTLLLAAQSQKQSLHYLYPLFPALACFMAIAVESLRGRLPKAAIALAAMSALALAVTDWSLGARFLEPNTTASATTWIHRHVPPETRVALDWAYVPKLYTADDFDELSESRVAAAAPGIVAAARLAHPVYRTERIDFSEGWLRTTRAEFLVTSSACFSRFFRDGLFTKKVPNPGTALYASFMKRRRFYSELFGSREWQLVSELATGNGPRTLIYRRAERGEVAAAFAPGG